MPLGSDRRIYMDYQASTPVDPRVSAAMMPYFFDHPGNPHASDHAYGWEAHAAVGAAAQRVATAIGADPDEIIFTSGATEANNLAVLGMAARAPSHRRRVLVSGVEHTCVLAATRAAGDRFGLTVEVLPVDHLGVLRVDVLKDRLADDVLLVAVMAVNNEIGTVEPLDEVSPMCQRVGAYLHVDGVQALATNPMDVYAYDIGTLSLSAHKLYGPKGIGALYVRRDLQAAVEPLMYGGGQQRGLRPGTLPVPLCVGFGEAAALMTDDDARAERRRVGGLRDRLMAGLCGIRSGIQINGPTGADRHPGNVNLVFPEVDAHDLLMSMQPGLAAATGSACTSGIPEPSHVLRAIGLTDGQARSSVRFGIGRFTTQDEVEGAIGIVRGALARAS